MLAAAGRFPGRSRVSTWSTSRRARPGSDWLPCQARWNGRTTTRDGSALSLSGWSSRLNHGPVRQRRRSSLLRASRAPVQPVCCSPKASRIVCAARCSGKDRFRALVAVDAGRHQPVEAAAVARHRPAARRRHCRRRTRQMRRCATWRHCSVAARLDRRPQRRRSSRLPRAAAGRTPAAAHRAGRSHGSRPGGRCRAGWSAGAPASRASTRPRSTIAGSPSTMPGADQRFRQAGIVVGQLTARTSPTRRAHSWRWKCISCSADCSTSQRARSWPGRRLKQFAAAQARRTPCARGASSSSA